MFENKKILAIIPARGGSKRLPRKNILPLSGKPLISWTIEAAKNSKYIDEVIVSTDDQEIADVAVKSGAKVPELRPSALSNDSATTESVVFYTLKKFGKQADIVILLQPTSPFRNEKHIDEALDLFSTKKAFSVVSVTPCEHPPLWANTIPENDSLGDFLLPDANKRSQELEKFYRLNGALYVFDVAKLLINNKMSYRSDSYAYRMNNESSLDIDTSLDFELAKVLMLNQ
ncbi:acylneuraminate cytidylyltransferase family protein [Shewanella sp. 0m-4]